MKAEQILQKSAKNNMKRWELNTFKITHPTLYKTIIEAINEAINYTRCCESDSELLKVLGEHIAEQFDHKAEDVIEQLEWKFKNL